MQVTRSSEVQCAGMSQGHVRTYMHDGDDNLHVRIYVRIGRYYITLLLLIPQCHVFVIVYTYVCVFTNTQPASPLHHCNTQSTSPLGKGLTLHCRPSKAFAMATASPQLNIGSYCTHPKEFTRPPSQSVPCSEVH